MTENHPVSSRNPSGEAPRPDVPIIVAAPDEPELIRRGLGAQLEAFGTRVRLLTTDDSARADVLLFDCFSWADSADPRTHVPPGVTESAIVAYSWHTRPERVRWALDHGFDGYLAKSLSAQELVEALEAVHESRRPVRLGQRSQTSSQPRRSVPCCLTRRETEILDLVCSGLRNAEIAVELHLTINSVKSYIRSAYRRIGVTTRSQAVVWGIQNGFGDASCKRLADL